MFYNFGLAKRPSKKSCVFSLCSELSGFLMVFLNGCVKRVSDGSLVDCYTVFAGR